jgi:hypothetical protein
VNGPDLEVRNADESDEVVLPMARHRAVIDLGGAHDDDLRSDELRAAAAGFELAVPSVHIRSAGVAPSSGLRSVAGK